MKYKATKTFLHDQLGLVVKGKEFEASAEQISGVRRFVTVLQDAPPPIGEIETKPEPRAPAKRKK